MNMTQKQEVSFESKGKKLAGHIYLPENYDESQKYTWVIVNGSWTTVKEQMAWTYAEKLAKKGYIALAYDSRGFWESEWDAMYFESPENKIEDIHSAVSYLQSRNDISQVWALGVCASAGYTLVAASENKDIKIIATVASWIHDRDGVESLYGWAGWVDAKIEQAKQAKQKYEENWEVEYVPTISETNENAAMYWPYDYYLNADRGAIKEWQADKFAVMSWDDWLNFDPTTSASKITQPIVMIHSEWAVLPQKTKEYYENLATEEKKIIWIDTDLQSPMHQFSFYDWEEEINKSIDEIISFFNTHISSS